MRTTHLLHIFRQVSGWLCLPSLCWSRPLVADKTPRLPFSPPRSRGLLSRIRCRIGSLLGYSREPDCWRYSERQVFPWEWWQHKFLACTRSAFRSIRPPSRSQSSSCKILRRQGWCPKFPGMASIPVQRKGSFFQQCLNY